MNYLPTNKCLRELRLSLTSEQHVNILPDQHRQQLLQFRSNVSYVIQNRTTVKECCKYFFLTWETLTSLLPNHPYYLPPLYTKDLNDSLESSLKELLLREVQEKFGSDINIGHIVLGGVEGAGKTTFLRALAFAIAILLDRMIPITHDFSTQIVTPSEVLKTVYPIWNSDSDEDSDPLLMFQKTGHDVALLFDEFQDLFLHSQHPFFLTGLKGTQQMHYYSRTYGTYGIIGGSTFDMRSLMFRNKTHPMKDIWCGYGYPDFNGTLYQFHQIPALRTSEDLKEYIQKRYPKWNLSSADISQLLFHTGGIGRWIHDCWKETVYSIEPDNNGDYSFLSLQQLKRTTGYRKISPEAFIETEDERKLIVYLSEFAAPIYHEDTKQLESCGGIDRTFLLEGLRNAGVESPTSVLYNAQAYSVIYVDNAESNVQFARPVDFDYFCHKLPPPKHQMLLLTAIHLMVKGIETPDKTNLCTDVNAGSALEEFVRPRVFQTVGENDAVIYDKEKIILINSEGKLCVKATDGSNNQVVNEEILLQLHHKHVSWSKEHGLDGLCLNITQQQQRKNNKQVWIVTIDAWQCKGGRFDVEIGGGNGSFETAVNNYKKKFHLKDVRDTQITEIVLKAQVGMVMVAKALLSSIPNLSIQPGKLVITTTKKLSLSCIETLDNWQSSEGINIQQEILEHFEIRGKQMRSKFAVKVVSGCKWVVESIPSQDNQIRQLADKLLGTTNDVDADAVKFVHRKDSCNVC
jgi:hypothetical protein